MTGHLLKALVIHKALQPGLYRFFTLRNAEICTQQLLQTAGKAGFQLRLCSFGKYFLQDFFYFFF